MNKIGTFINIKKQNFYFNGCADCEGICCNGAKGFALSPLILDDFEKVYKNFAIVFTIIGKKLRALVVLNDGKSFCKYYVDNKCSIYEERTPSCKLYPIAPYFDDILVDTSCPSINFEIGDSICNQGKIDKKFFTDRLKNFNQKLIDTYNFLETIYDINDFKFIGHVKGTPLLKYTKETNDIYIKMHLESLVHFK